MLIGQDDLQRRRVEADPGTAAQAEAVLEEQQLPASIAGEGAHQAAVA